MRQDNAEGSSSMLGELSERQRAVLVGTLLGDGCLAKHGYYHRLHIKHKEAHRGLVEFKYQGGKWLYVGAADLSRLRDSVEPFLLPEFRYKLVPRRLEPRRDCTLAPDESRGEDTVRPRWQQREALQKWEPAKMDLGQYSE